MAKTRAVRAGTIGAFAVLAAGLGVRYAATSAPNYSATALVFVSPTLLTNPGDADVAQASGSLALDRMASYQTLSGSPEFARAVLSRVPVTFAESAFNDHVSVAVNPRTVTMTVTGRSADPATAVALANGSAVELTAEITSLEAPLGTTPPVNPVVAGRAEQPKGPERPSVLLYGGAGLVGGALLGAVVVSLLRRRRRPDVDLRDDADLDVRTAEPVNR